MIKSIPLTYKYIGECFWFVAAWLLYGMETSGKENGKIQIYVKKCEKVFEFRLTRPNGYGTIIKRPNETRRKWTLKIKQY